MQVLAHRGLVCRCPDLPSRLSSCSCTSRAHTPHNPAGFDSILLQSSSSVFIPVHLVRVLMPYSCNPAGPCPHLFQLPYSAGSRLLHLSRAHSTLRAQQGSQPRGFNRVLKV
ncbi:hypothetical protein DPEC_G00361620 [Dallia pectoralis]|nr:hypothetical protein DPEC_G00361620 [Dallia pectoralis]